MEAEVQKVDFQPARAGVPYKHIPTRSFDPDSGVFFLQSDSGETRLGVCFESVPIIGADESTVSRLQSVLTTRMPADTFVQIGLLSEPDVSFLNSLYLQKKVAAEGVLGEMTRRRVDMLSAGVDKALKGMNDVYLNRQRVIVTVTIPCSNKKEEIAESIKTLVDLSVKIKDGFGSVGLWLNQMDEASYLALMRRFFYLYERDDYTTDEYKELREQIFAPSTNVNFDKTDEIVFDGGKYFAKMLAVKHFPQTAGIGLMNMLIGDPMGSANQITDPFWLSATIYYPNQDQKLASVRKKHAWLTNQAFGPMSSLIPMLGYKKRGVDVLIHEIDGGGGTLCELNFTMTLFSRERERLAGLASSWRAWANSFGFEMREDTRILQPMFYNVLPMGTTVNGIKALDRFSTMCVSHAVHHLPILGNWTGSGRGGMGVLVGRRGQLALFDPYDSNSNYNGVIAAEPGAGKSVAANQLICDMLASGGRAWAIDQGRSYEKLAGVLGDKAQFIEFSETSNICLNPFTTVDDINDDMDMLKAIITKMAAPNGGFEDFHLSAIEAKILAAFNVTGKKTTITMVAEQCLNDQDPRIKDIGTQLYSFTSRGSFGRWFDGDNNVDLSKDFVVLEIQELQNKKVLQQVVLLLLFSSIGHEMYLSHDGRRKLLLIDEAWALLDDPIMAKAIVSAYRKVRKHSGSAWLVTQSIADLYNSPSGLAILNSCAWQIIMQQKSDSIDRLVKSQQISIDAYTANMMKSIHTMPGAYAEMMVRNGTNWGVGRLIIDRFSQVLFSTTGREREEVLAKIRAGGNAVEVINQFIAENG